MKVYCDRIGKVVPNKAGQIECPKCRGICNKNIASQMFNCVRCGRGWSEIPDHITTEGEAEKFLMEGTK